MMGRLQFEDFELRIGRGHGESYPTWVVRSPAGEANGTLNLPFGPARLKDIKTHVELAMLRSRQRTRAALTTELRELKTFGGDLFDALFHGAIQATFESSRNLAFSQGKGLRLKLRIEPGELIDMPWEFLYDKAARRFVALSARTPVVRYIELESPLPPLEITPPLHLLVVVASPSDYASLDVAREANRIHLALGDLINRGLVQVDFLPNATLPAVQDRLREEPVHILHFIGHGDYVEEREAGVLVFEDEHGEGRRVRGEQLRHLFGDVLSLRLVVLNACSGARGWDREQDPLRAYPGIAESLVHEGIAGVVANQFEVTDEAAIIFARELYSALADSYPIDAAVAEARKAIDLSLKHTVEWASPVLYSRAPDGLIFDIREVDSDVRTIDDSELERAPVPELSSPSNDNVGGLLDPVSAGGANQQNDFSGFGFRLATLSVLAILIFTVGFAAQSAVSRLVGTPTPPLAVIAQPFTTSTPTSTAIEELPQFTSISTPTASPTVSSTWTSLPTATATATFTPTGRVSALPAVITATGEGVTSLNLREGPSTMCDIVGGVSVGEEVMAHGGWPPIDDSDYQTGWGWVLVETEAGSRAWVWGAALELKNHAARVPEIPAEEVPSCALLQGEKLPPATPVPSATPQSDDSGVPAHPTATATTTPLPTATPTKSVSSTVTPSSIRPRPRPPTPTPALQEF